MSQSGRSITMAPVAADASERLLVPELLSLIYRHAADEESLDFIVVATATQTITDDDGATRQVPEGYTYVAISARDANQRQQFWSRVNKIRSLIVEIDQFREGRLAEARARLAL